MLIDHTKYKTIGQDMHVSTAEYDGMEFSQ